MSKKDLYYCLTLLVCAVLAIGSGVIMSIGILSPIFDTICLAILCLSWYIGLLVLGSFAFHLLRNDGK